MTDEPGRPREPGSSEPVGTLAEEAARLFAALAGVARDHGADDAGSGGRAASDTSDQSRPPDLGDWAAAAVHEIDDHLATGGEECRYCPVCRAVGLVRRTSPEAVDHLAESARSLSRAVAAMLATANVEDRRAQSKDRQSKDRQSKDGQGREGRGRKGMGVEHIDLDDSVDVGAETDEQDLEEDA